MASNEQAALRTCQCGWSKVTTYRGLRIHQGKTKCGGYGEAQPYISSTFLTSPSQSWTACDSITRPSVAHKQPGEHTSLHHLRQTYGILGISLQDELQQGTLSNDWTRRDVSRHPADGAREETSMTTPQSLRNILELREKLFTKERPLGNDPKAALRSPATLTDSDELETLKKENECLKDRCKEFKAANEKTTAALKALERQNEDLKTRCSEMKASREKLNAETETLKKENESLKFRYDELKASREKLNAETQTLKKENESLKFRVQECLAKTGQEKERVRNTRQAQHPCETCGHYITHMYNEFLASRPDQAYEPPCQQCDDEFVQLYQDYLKAKQLGNDYKSPCEQCKEEYNSLCSENFAMKAPGKAFPQSCQDCGHNIKQLATILQIPTGNAIERSRANPSSEDTHDSCSETELKKEFEQLKRNEFPKALKSIKSQTNTQDGKALKVKMQWTFDIAKRDMVRKQEELQRIFPADAKNETPAQLQLAFNNLQTALYNCSESHYRSLIQEFIEDEPKEVAALLVGWYRLSCLMALHSPPLVPKWDADVFPCSLDSSI